MIAIHRLSIKTLSATTILVCGLLFAVGVWWLHRLPSLEDFESKLASATTEKEHELVIDQLEEYYGTLTIPDSINDHVNKQVAKLLKSHVDVSNVNSGSLQHVNPYELENRLAVLLKTAIILCAQEEEAAFREQMAIAHGLATTVNERTTNHYWVPYVGELRRYSPVQATVWLQADRAAQACNSLIDTDYAQSEKYGALALQKLSQVEDPRLKQGIMQRLQYILYQYRRKPQLSISLAERYYDQAFDIKNYLRAAGIKCHRMAALRDMGRIDESLKVGSELIAMTDAYHQVPYIIAYKKKGLLLMTDPYWRSGRYDDALAICSTLEEFELTSIDSMFIHNMRGLVHQKLGNFETADAEFQAGVRIADANNHVFNRVQYRMNLASMYGNLTEYDKAFDYYGEVKDLIAKTELENGDHFINLFMNLNTANLSTRDDKDVLVEDLLGEVQRLMKSSASDPLKQASLMFTMGQLNFAIGKLEDSYNNFQAAEVVCDENNLDVLGLEVKVNLTRSLLRIDRRIDAKKKISKVLNRARQKEEFERIIDALALLAEIEHADGSTANAIQFSNELIRVVEQLGPRLSDSTLWTALRQKIYDYLKQSVAYEIYNNEIDSALIKLSLAKSNWLKIAPVDSGSAPPRRSKSLGEGLGADDVAIDFLLMPDTLYVFVLTQDGVRLHKKATNKRDLERIVSQYKEQITRTLTILREYNDVENTAHFAATNELSNKLFTELLGWLPLDKILVEKQTLYISPDESLYETPFATLLMDTTSDSRYLVDQIGIVYTKSSLSIDVETEDRIDPAQQKVLVSIDPDIPGSKELHALIKRVLPFREELTVSGAPTKPKVLDVLGRGFDGAIIFGHAVANSRRPDLSYIEFTVNGSTPKYEKIRINVGELKHIKWTESDMVMLIGCESGGGKLYRGTGVVGLPRSFINLGTRHIVATMWKIDAAYAVRQTSQFIEAWAAGSKPVKALREMQLNSIQALKRNKYIKSPHPYYWGSYNLLCGNRSDSI